MAKTTSTTPDPELIITFPNTVTLNGVDYDQLVLSEPTVNQFQTATAKAKSAKSDDNTLMMSNLIALVANVDHAVVQRLPISRFKIAAEYISTFLE